MIYKLTMYLLVKVSRRKFKQCMSVDHQQVGRQEICYEEACQSRQACLDSLPRLACFLGILHQDNQLLYNYCAETCLLNHVSRQLPIHNHNKLLVCKQDLLPGTPGVSLDPLGPPLATGLVFVSGFHHA